MYRSVTPTFKSSSFSTTWKRFTAPGVKLSIRRFSEAKKKSVKVCIVGSGPAGFYTAESLLKNHPNVKIDIMEKLPVPFGLVRFGVSPDHPEVKVVSNKFDQILQDERCRYLGNVEVGASVSTEELQRYYDAVVLSYGSENEKMLNIQGEGLEGVYASRDFVGWFNGHPHYKYIAFFMALTNTRKRNLQFDLSGESAVIVGQGNVALDVARMLLKPWKELAETDITSYALEALKANNIKRVHIVGRRGVAQAAFTNKELREVLSVTNCTTYVKKDEMTVNEYSLEEMQEDRGKRRMMELLEKKAKIIEHEDEVPPEQGDQKSLFIRFLSSPVEIIAHNNHVSSVKMEKNVLVGKDPQRAQGTGVHYHIPCSVLFRSIGYAGVGIPGVPFSNGIIPNVGGRVIDPNTKQPIKGLYVSGWIKRGPSGIIGTNRWDAEETVDNLLVDMKSASEPSTEREDIVPLLEQRVQIVGLSGWKRISQEEERRGQRTNKPREKLTSVEEMLQVAKDVET